MLGTVAMLCLVAVSLATPPFYYPGVHRAAAPGYGKVAVQNEVYEPQPYSFGYDTVDEYGNSQSRKEDGDEHGNVRGSYGYVDAYGIYRQVEYVADHDGFRATVKTNEPGTANQNPADVEVLSEAVPVHYDAPINTKPYSPKVASPAYNVPALPKVVGKAPTPAQVAVKPPIVAKDAGKAPAAVKAPAAAPTTAKAAVPAPAYGAHHPRISIAAPAYGAYHAGDGIPVPAYDVYRPKVDLSGPVYGAKVSFAAPTYSSYTAQSHEASSDYAVY